MQTFIVRVWTPSPDRAREWSELELRGKIERVGSSEHLAFRSSAELVDLLREALRHSADASVTS